MPAPVQAVLAPFMIVIIVMGHKTLLTPSLLRVMMTNLLVGSIRTPMTLFSKMLLFLRIFRLSTVSALRSASGLVPPWRRSTGQSAREIGIVGGCPLGSLLSEPLIPQRLLPATVSDLDSSHAGMSTVILMSLKLVDRSVGHAAAPPMWTTISGSSAILLMLPDTMPKAL